MSFKEKVAKFMKASALKHELSFDRSPRDRLGEGKASPSKDVENSVSCRKLVNIWESRAKPSDTTPSTPPRVERLERPPPGSTTTEESFSSPKAGGPPSSAGDYAGSESDSVPSHQDDVSVAPEETAWAKPVTVYVEELFVPTNTDQGAAPAKEALSVAPVNATPPLPLGESLAPGLTAVAAACAEDHSVSPPVTPSEGNVPSAPEPCRRVCPTCSTVLRAAPDGVSDDESSMSAATWVEPPTAQAAESTTAERSPAPATLDIAVRSAHKEQLVLRVVKAAAACVILLALGGGIASFSSKGSSKKAPKEEEPSSRVVLGGLFGSSTPPPYLLRDSYYSASPPTSKMFPVHPPPSFSVSRG